MLKQCSQNGLPSRWKNAGFSNGLSQLCTQHESGTNHTQRKGTRTAQVKHSQHHFPPSASTACIPSRMLFLHFLHLGIRSRTWHVSQYGWPLYTVKPTSSSALAVNAPSPANVRDGAPGSEGGRNGSPHSAQKKCCSWYVRFPSSGSSSVMNRSSTITVSQW